MIDGPLLPVTDVLPDLLAALENSSNAVLIAPPGAGKTTGVPLALLQAAWLGERRILMLEPRRVAARAAAERMASVLGERVGATVGYRIRDERAISNATKIEVITEGILTRRLQSDPSLDDVGIVIFDEYHERSIHADLGLALCLDSQSALRDDLRLLVMSATLDGAAVGELLGDATTIESQGRAFPVETRWLETSWRHPSAPRDAFERAAATQTAQAVAEEHGDVLVFLPGVREIERVRGLLDNDLSKQDVSILPLHGGMAFQRQNAVLDPPADGQRRVVLASAIAETSLTIKGVRVVVDAGLSRRAQFDVGAGMTRLVTRRVSRSSAEQRRGRAGRTSPGVCYRLWTKGEEGGMMLADPPEILEADISPLILDLACWGVTDPSTLRWLDPPPDPVVNRTRELLIDLGALDREGRATDHGKAMAELPLHPRLAHMVIKGKQRGVGNEAAELAAILDERDPLSNTGVDIAHRLEALRDDVKFQSERSGTINVGALSRIRKSVKRLKHSASDQVQSSPGPLVALAYPDRVAQRRSGDAPRYVMAGGKGAILADTSDPLANEPFLALAHLDGNPREARIRLAAPVTRAEIESLFENRIEEVSFCEWDARNNRVTARKQIRLGSVVLDDTPWKRASAEAIASAAADGVRALGLTCLPWSGAATRLRDRVRWARAADQACAIADMTDEALLNTLNNWLTPHLGSVRTAADFNSLALEPMLRALLDWEHQQLLDRLAPNSLLTPAKTKAPIDYSMDIPAVEVRIQEMFGATEHPTICEGRVPIQIRFMSPARRAVQVTSDLPGFWANSYADVRKDLRGRYPRHPWPEDPANAEPTTRATRRRR